MSAAVSMLARLRRVAVPFLTAALVSAGCGAAAKVAELAADGPTRELRKRPRGATQSSPGRPALLLLALDGVDRGTLYDLLRKGELPVLSELLGGRQADGTFAHAHLDERLLSTLPSSTMAAWTTAMTGLTPAVHGVTGNEFFVRESLRLGAPAPVSFHDSKPTLEIYTDGYLDALKHGPSVYERIRAKDPDVLVWVAMHPIYSGADRLLVTKRTVLTQAFEHVVATVAAKAEGKTEPRRIYESLDKQVIEVLTEELEKGPVPDVLTVYLSGLDLYAHVADEGPDLARRVYLKEVVDPALAPLIARLRQRNALDARYVVLTADHGHTEVLSDARHALGTDDPDDPPALLAKAGFRVRPFERNVDEKKVFDAVWVAGGAMAYVYVADRSTCPQADQLCNWRVPPRWKEDVLPLADAFFRADADGALVPAMKGTIDFVLTRKPVPQEQNDLPFEVYVGDGKTVPLDLFLREHPHPTYVDLVKRLAHLGVGPRGERAGDVLLLAHNGDRDDIQQRYYFADLYRSWHGSPSRRDSEIPFVVAHPRHTSRDLGARVSAVLGAEPYQQKVTDMLLDLRFGTP